MSVFRDVFRRKLRSVLTISGVAVGVFAIVLLGAFAEKVNVNLDIVRDMSTQTVTVLDERGVGVFGMSDGTRPLSAEKQAEVETVEGVRRAAPMVVLMLDDEAAIMWTPSMLMGSYARDWPEQLSMSKGRLYADDESGVTVIGHDLAAQLDVEVGDTVELRGRRFEVVGLLERSLVNVYDQAAMVPIADARALYIEWLPETFRSRIEPADINTQLTVFPEEGVDGDALAARIVNEVDGVAATSPSDSAEYSQSLTDIVNAVIVSVGFIALVVGALSILNTMLVAIAERTHEIGTKRALGASKWRIARDVLAESVVIGACAGVVGLVGGAVVATVMNAAITAQTGVGLFLITGKLGVATVVFALILGGVAGLYPAWRASQLDPVIALAHE